MKYVYNIFRIQSSVLNIPLFTSWGELIYHIHLDQNQIPQNPESYACNVSRYWLLEWNVYGQWLPVELCDMSEKQNWDFFYFLDTGHPLAVSGIMHATVKLHIIVLTSSVFFFVCFSWHENILWPGPYQFCLKYSSRTRAIVFLKLFNTVSLLLNNLVGNVFGHFFSKLFNFVSAHPPVRFGSN